MKISTNIKKKNSINLYKVGLHVLFWLCTLIYEAFIWGMVDGEYLERLAFSSIELPIKIIAAYFTLYYIIDKLLLPRKYTLFVFVLVLSMVVFGIVLRTLSYYTVY